MTEHTLPERLRDAADTLDEFAMFRGVHPGVGYSPGFMRDEADKIEQAAIEIALKQTERAAKVDELAERLRVIHHGDDIASLPSWDTLVNGERNNALSREMLKRWRRTAGYVL